MMAQNVKKKFAIFGNCQAACLRKFLQTNDYFNKDYDCIDAYYVPGLKADDIDKIYANVFNKLDLIIIQPITEKYGKMSTQSILKQIKDDCIVILFPSCYFSFYHPYSKSIVHDKYFQILINPSWHIHDIELIRLYLKKDGNEDKILQEYCRMLSSPNYFDANFLKKLLNSNLSELMRREGDYPTLIDKRFKRKHIIKLSRFISQNYSRSLLFYTYAHPTKKVYHYLADQVLSYLKYPLKPYPVDLDPQNDIVVPLYKSLEQLVKFNVWELKLATTDQQHDVTIVDYIKKCLNVYRQIDNATLINIVNDIKVKVNKHIMADTHLQNRQMYNFV